MRPAVNAGHADCIPIFLFEIPRLFQERYIDLDIALINVSPPDDKGYCSLGTSVDCTRAAVDHSKRIVGKSRKILNVYVLFRMQNLRGNHIFIGLINKSVPRTFGDATIHISKLDFAVEHDQPLAIHPTPVPSKTEQEIGRYIAENLVADGATLQLGIGTIPDAVLALLRNHKDLGIHSEMFSDGIIDLVERGCLTNNMKTMHKGRIVGSFCMGTQKLFSFMDNNPFIG